MVLKNRLILLLPLISYFVTFYKSTWLPGNKMFINTSFYVMEVLTVVTFLLFVDFSVLNSGIRFFYKENKILTISAFLLLISSVFFNMSEFKSPYYTSFYLAYLFNFGIYFIMLPLFIINNKEYFYKFVNFISVFSLVFCFLGLCFLFLGISTEVRFQGKVTSIMVHPNFVPSVALVGLFSTLILLHTCDKSQLNKKLLFAISFFIQFIALAFSFTRDGMIAFVVGIAVFYFITYRKIFFYSLPVSIVLVPLFVVEFIKYKGFMSFVSRFLLLIPAYYLMISDKTRLLWGYGASNATDMYVKYKVLYNVLEDVNSPHNSYISYILMYGLIFTAVFSFFVLYLLYKGFRFSNRLKDHNSKVVVAAFISICIAYLVINLFESHLAMAHLTMMHPFLIFLGLLFYVLRNQTFLDDIKKSRESVF